jgi:hypothetical protein
MGHELNTKFHAAARLVQKRKPHWRTAEVVLMAAEDQGLLMHARIEMLKALSHGKPASTQPATAQAMKNYRIVR